MEKGFIIAIDGPAASGKGTIAARLAKDLSGFYLYTGAMYRCIALMCINKGLDLEKPESAESVLPELNIEFKEGSVFLNGENVTERLKKPDTASGASVVGVNAGVREWVDSKLRIIADKACSKGTIVVSEGRDTATVIFPDASIKIYLTASSEVRAKRRMNQYSHLSEDDLRKAFSDLKMRDERDTGRQVSPLSIDPEKLGYFVLDNSDMNEKETLDAIKSELRNRKLI